VSRESFKVGGTKPALLGGGRKWTSVGVGFFENLYMQVEGVRPWDGLMRGNKAESPCKCREKGVNVLPPGPIKE